MLNREIFSRDPLDFKLPNDGVAKVGEPTTEDEWDVLKFELQTFVCEGEYLRGLQRILQSFLSSLARPTQPAVWVSGFYGSGKSHLVRVLQYLWSDTKLPDGATARGLVQGLPDDIQALLKELSTEGRRAGGLWAAAGKLSGGAGDSIRLAVLRLVFQAAGLPTNYAQATFMLWLEHEGIKATVLGDLEAQGRNIRRELQNLYASAPLAQALIKAKTEIAESSAQALDLLRKQFPPRDEISEEDFLATMQTVLESVSDTPGKLPLSLLVLDELEQYVDQDPSKMERVQSVVEACSSRFGGSLLLVATGQSALQASAQMSKMKDRFTVRVELASSDVETVLRNVALRKDERRRPALAETLERYSGEIDRQLAGTRVAPQASDREVLVADYPLLPARRRFWERVLRAIDRAGTAGQVRTQLRIALEAAREVASSPVGTVVGGDFLYGQLRDDMLKSGALLAEVETLIAEQRKLPDGELRARLAGLVFLIGKLPTGGAEDAGVRATAETLADLLVRDLEQDGARLRQEVPRVLTQMVESGILMLVGGEYRLQSKASSEWEADYRVRLRGIDNDEALLASERQSAFKAAVTQRIGNLRLAHGESKAPRRLELTFSSEAPASSGGEVPIWVRDGWQLSEKDARDEARQQGRDSPTVTVFIPRERADELKRTLAEALAAKQVLETRAAPADHDGREARSAMESRQAAFRADLAAIISGLLDHAIVLQGGGAEVAQGDLAASVKQAAENAVGRLFPEFGTADDRRWEKVVSRARAGNPDPLNEVGYTGEPDKHPVTQKLLAHLASGPKNGAAIRKHFAASPYGWPQDAIDGGLLVLVGSGHLRAELDGSPRTVRQLDQSNLGKVHLRTENAVVTMPQKLELRKLFTDAGVSFQRDEEASAGLSLVEKLRAAAREAGGPAPQPTAPSPPLLQALAALRGNDLLLALHANKDALVADLRRWEDTRRKLDARLPRWQLLERLLEHSADLPTLASVKERRASLVAHRGLLNEPDPVAPLIEEATDALRRRVSELREAHAQRFETEMTALEQHPAWQSLAPQDAQGLLQKHGVSPLPEAKLGSPDEVLETLSALPLPQLADRLAALPSRFAAALADAVAQSAPQAVRVKTPAAKLESEAEVDAYLERLKRDIMAHIGEGRPVIL